MILEIIKVVVQPFLNKLNISSEDSGFISLSWIDTELEAK